MEVVGDRNKSTKLGHKETVIWVSCDKNYRRERWMVGKERKREREEMKEGERERGRKKGQGRILEIFGKSI